MVFFFNFASFNNTYLIYMNNKPTNKRYIYKGIKQRQSIKVSYIYMY